MESQKVILTTGYPPARLCHNSKKCLICTCHAGLDPASSSASPWKITGFRVKPGMTNH